RHRTRRTALDAIRVSWKHHREAAAVLLDFAQQPEAMRIEAREVERHVRHWRRETPERDRAARHPLLTADAGGQRRVQGPRIANEQQVQPDVGARFTTARAQLELPE